MIISGVKISDGITMGPAYIYRKFNLADQNIVVGSVEEELQKYEQALTIAKEQLKSLYLKAMEELGPEKSLLFEVHQMLMQDDDFVDEVKSLIKKGEAAPLAVNQVGEEFAQMMQAMDDSYMQARALDFRDISQRLVRILCGQTENIQKLQVPSLIIAEDLEPSETVAFDKSLILGFILMEGTSNSHTAILARGMNVPAIIQVKKNLSDFTNEEMILLDAKEGLIIKDPTQAEIDTFQVKIKEETEKIRALEAFRGLPTTTANGKKIKLYNNIGNVTDIEQVHAFDAEGVGLFRSEFLYMGRKELPTEEEQFKIYKKTIESLNGKPLIIRTMDIGADKKVDCLDMPHEENPALGKRAIRICLADKDLFHTQLRAILRASAFGPISIMFPMIISCEEILACKAALEECKDQLRNEGKAFLENMSVGIMIETPASVMLADEMAKLVDFFSVGTNDLTQYTLAVDRQNDAIAHLYSAKNPAVLKMLEMIAKAAVDNGIWAGVCGELGSDPEVTEKLLRYGFTELSVSPGKTLKLRQAISKINLDS